MTIVVTHVRPSVLTNMPHMLDIHFAHAGFGAYAINLNGVTIFNLVAQGERDYDIPATDVTPRILADGLSIEELGFVLGAVDRAGAVGELDNTFKEMAANNVTLNVVVANAPNDVPATQYGEISFTAVPNADGSQSFLENSTATITIYEDRLSRTGDHSFEASFAHELGHLTRGPDGKFLLADNHVHEARVNEIWENIVEDIDPSNYTSSVDQLVQTISNNVLTLYGTEGNNLIESTYGDEKIWSGSGNDILVAGPGNDSIMISGSGMKIVADYDYGWDVIYLLNIWQMTELKMTRVGDDAYLTHVSVSDVLEDKNAVVLADYYFAPLAHVEFVRTANGDLKQLWLFDDNPIIAGSNTFVQGGLGQDELFTGERAGLIYGDGERDYLGGGSFVDTLDGGDGNDTLDGGSNADSLLGGNGDDQIVGADGNDNAIGGLGEDFLYGELGNDSLSGSEGADRMYGREGEDTLHGDDQKDFLRGGGDRDILRGGGGADVFDYDDVVESVDGIAAGDRIKDFSVAQGDVIDLGDVDAVAGAAGSGFTFIGSAAFSHAAGQLRYEVSGSKTYILADVNGDALADLEIELDGAILLTSDCFVL